MPLKDGPFTDYRCKDDPVCPWCDYKIDISRHELYQLYEEDSHYIKCPKCDKELCVRAEASWVFHTDEQDDEESAESEGAKP